jgi:hypothetical protein
MNQRNASTRAPATARVRRYLLRAGLALLLATSLLLVTGDAAVESAEPTATPSPSPAATATATSQPETASTPTPRPTKAPTATPTPTPTPVPAQDLAVAFFGNLCEFDHPLMATVFNTSATPLTNRTVRLRLTTQTGLLEQHDHYLSLEPLGSANLPLAHKARAPWVRIEVFLLDAPEDPNPDNDSYTCDVAAPSPTETPVTQPTQTPSGRALPVSGGPAGDATLRQTSASPTAPPVNQVQATRAPARAQTNSPQPSLTPISDAGGGLAPPPAEGSLLDSRTLMLAAVVFLAGGSSWAFYYLTRPPRNA